jgi:hypothetical protein
MAKGSAELSEFAPTKFEPMIDAGAAKHIEEEVRNVNNTLRGFKRLIVAVER